tara:strand:+ start:342 stop:923 length:582 start_codon:yes stop_codon:yes gene_type:complete
MSDIDNKFLNIEPQQAVAGTNWKWKRSFSNFPASLWTLSYYFREVTGKYSFDIVATNLNDTFQINLPFATTDAYAPGVYSGQGFVSYSNDKFLVYENQLEVGTNFTLQGVGKDTRSHSQKVLEAIKGLLEGKFVEDASSYSIAGRSITKLAIQELIDAKNYYESIVVMEIRNQRAKQGLQTGQVVRARFTSEF